MLTDKSLAKQRTQRAQKRGAGSGVGRRNRPKARRLSGRVMNRSPPFLLTKQRLHATDIITPLIIPAAAFVVYSISSSWKCIASRKNISGKRKRINIYYRRKSKVYEFVARKWELTIALIFARRNDFKSRSTYLKSLISPSDTSLKLRRKRLWNEDDRVISSYRVLSRKFHRKWRKFGENPPFGRRR